MYCPTCGSEERQLSQYCRACGTDLRSVRVTLERPDAITASAISGRDQISRAFADKIRETRSVDDLKQVAEEVLPEVEKFLESPEEKRLRRIRAGIVMTFIGLGAICGVAIASMHDEGILVVMMPAMAAFFIGLGILVNGLMFSLPRKRLPKAEGDTQAALELEPSQRGAPDTAGFSPGPRLVMSSNPASASVTEHTTRHLADEK
jgi:hypothetical protein